MIQERDDIVALDSAIIQHPRTWEASGHLAGLHRSARAVPGQVQAALPRGPPARGAARGRAALPRLRRRAERAACLQPDVRDHDRPGEGGGLDGLPAAGDGAGHLPRLQDHARLRAPQAAVRHRAGRQVVPQRDHARQLHLPHARVRADGDGVLRAARRGGRWYDYWRQARLDWYVRSASTASACGCASTTTTSCRTTRPRPPTSSTCTRSAGRSWRAIANRGDFDLTQHAKSSGEKLEYFDQQTRERYVPHVIEPAAGVGRTVLALLCDAYDEDEIGGERAPCCGSTRGRARQGRGAPAAAQGRPPRAGARDLRGAAPRT